jgi:hypothetical protein
VAQKKSMHMTTFRYLVNELEKELKEIAVTDEAKEKQANDEATGNVYHDDDGVVNQFGLIRTILTACQNVVTQHDAVDATIYLNEDIYRILVAESLDVKHMGKDMFLIWLYDGKSIGKISSFSLPDASRYWRMLQERKLFSLPRDSKECVEMALGLCRRQGLVRNHINERNTFQETPLLSAISNCEK